MEKPTHRVMILSGFLGSGKTTFLNRLLKQADGRRLAVIVNEFGEIGLDAALINAPGEFVKMDNGCLCCALNEDLAKTLESLKDRDDFDAVVVETTGIADPLTVAWTFLRPQMEGRYRIGTLTTIVDAQNLESMLQSSREATDQIRQADILCLSKTDLVKDLTHVTSLLRNINPNARFTDTSSVDWAYLALKSDASITLAPAQKQTPHDFQNLSIDLKGKIVTLEMMEDFFSELPSSVMRAKAVFQDPVRGFLVVHSVCGHIDFEVLEEYRGPEAVVFIGRELKGLKEKFLKMISLS